VPNAQFGQTQRSNKGSHDGVLPAIRSGEQELSKIPMISIVDDDEAVRESTKALVRSLGYNARAFGSAEEFLESNPDDTSCLILDIQMKGLSGVELQELLIAQGRRTPIIFVTAFPDQRTRNHALDAGAIGFLSKPFSDEKLTKFLDLALANQSPE
jgi:FixJ family two-component response regulator